MSAADLRDAVEALKGDCGLPAAKRVILTKINALKQREKQIHGAIVFLEDSIKEIP